MCYGKLSFMWILAFCASLYFSIVEVKGLRFDDAKTEVRDFLDYLLPELGVIGADLSAIYNAGELDDLATTANGYITSALSNTLNWILHYNPDKAVQIRDVYTNYQIAYTVILEEEEWSKNTEIPLAYILAERLFLYRQEFNLDLAKKRIKRLLRFLSGVLLGYRSVNLSAIDNADSLEALTAASNIFLSQGDVNNLRTIALGGYPNFPDIPSEMQYKFYNYQQEFTDSLLQDPLTRGKPIPLIEDIAVISSAWQ